MDPSATAPGDLDMGFAFLVGVLVLFAAGVLTVLVAHVARSARNPDYRARTRARWPGRRAPIDGDAWPHSPGAWLSDSGPVAPPDVSAGPTPGAPTV